VLHMNTLFFTGIDSCKERTAVQSVHIALCRLSSHPQTRCQYRRHLKALVCKHNIYAFMLSLLPHNLLRQIHAHCHCFILHTGARRTQGQVGYCTTYNLRTLISLFHLRLHFARGVFPSDFLKSCVILTIPDSSHAQN
jgi:hypothetical protein